MPVFMVCCAIVALSSGAAAQAQSEPALDPAPKPIRVVTFNLYNRPTKRALRLDRIEAVLEALDADVVALQEVARYFRSDPDPAARFAARLGYAHHLHWNEDSLWFSTGEAVLSRFPIREQGGKTFRRNQLFDNKGYAWVVLETPQGPLGVVSVHLVSEQGGDTKADEIDELKHFVAALAKRVPVVLAGDFNEPYDTPLMQWLAQSLALANLFTSVPRGPAALKTWAGGYGNACDDPSAERIDAIYLAPRQLRSDLPPRWRFVEGGVVATVEPYPSDHCPVAAAIRLEGGSQ
ncbi:MAG: endonuclease/exonuclease/phosphatase family protein [Deltaproteobacteria bacterium]|nr:endonuclease/exonuclease/phosphatase family protein [Deltaproteobacteria bacterium]